MWNNVGKARIPYGVMVETQDINIYQNGGDLGMVDFIV